MGYLVKKFYETHKKFLCHLYLYEWFIFLITLIIYLKCIEIFNKRFTWVSLWMEVLLDDSLNGLGARQNPTV